MRLEKGRRGCRGDGFKGEVREQVELVWWRRKGMVRNERLSWNEASGGGGLEDGEVQGCVLGVEGVARSRLR